MAEMAKDLKGQVNQKRENGEGQLVPMKNARVGLTFGLYID